MTWKPVENVSASSRFVNRREPLFEFEVDVECAVEQARARAPGPEHREGHRSGLLHLGVVGEPEIVVRTQHDEFFAEVRDNRILSRRNGAVIGIDPSISNLRVILRGISALLENVHSITSVEPSERGVRSFGGHPHPLLRPASPMALRPMSTGSRARTPPRGTQSSCVRPLSGRSGPSSGGDLSSSTVAKTPDGPELTPPGLWLSAKLISHGECTPDSRWRGPRAAGPDPTFPLDSRSGAPSISWAYAPDSRPAVRRLAPREGR